jgi:hypothetical protein
MYALKALILAYGTAALAAPMWSSFDDMESQDIDAFDVETRALEGFEEFKVRGLADFESSGLYVRTVIDLLASDDLAINIDGEQLSEPEVCSHK